MKKTNLLLSLLFISSFLISSVAAYSFISNNDINTPQQPILQQERHHSSKKCVTQYAYDKEENKFIKRDLVRFYEWKHPRTGETKIIKKIIMGEKCKILDKKKDMTQTDISPLPFEWNVYNLKRL